MVAAALVIAVLTVACGSSSPATRAELAAALADRCATLANATDGIDVPAIGTYDYFDGLTDTIRDSDTELFEETIDKDDWVDFDTDLLRGRIEIAFIDMANAAQSARNMGLHEPIEHFSDYLEGLDAIRLVQDAAAELGTPGACDGLESTRAALIVAEDTFTEPWAAFALTGDPGTDITAMCARAAEAVGGDGSASFSDQILVRATLDDALDQLYNELSRLDRTPLVDELIDATATYRGAARVAAAGQAVDLADPALAFGAAAEAVGAQC